MRHNSKKEYDYLGKSASTMDCTGLIPSGPVNEKDLEDYQELYTFGGKQMTDSLRNDVLDKNRTGKS